MTVVWPHGDPRDVARAILADPRYHLAARPAAAPTVLDLAWAWVVGQLRRLLHGIDHVLGAHDPFGVAVGVCAIAAALALLGYGVYAGLRSFARGARPAPRRGAATPVSVVRDAAALRTAALAAAAARRYRDAAGLLFAAAAHALDERGRLAFDPARTPGEYRRLVRDPRFDGLAGDAVTAVFAAAEPPHELFERMRVAYDGLFDDGRPG